MDSSLVYSIIQRITSGDTASAEHDIETYRQSDVDGFVRSIFNVISQHQSEVAVIQSALLILKIIIPKSWSIGFEEFAGPPISHEIKAEARSLLVDHLIGHPVNKVRSVAALLTANIASVEYPDEWPTLIDSVSNLILNGNTYQVFGGLSTLKELVGETITEAEFRQTGALILSTLYSVASSPSETSDSTAAANESTGTKTFSPFASAIALEIFTGCADLFVLPSNTDSPEAKLASQVVSQWGPLLVQYLGRQINSQDLGWIFTKMEAAKAFSALLAVLPKLASQYAPNAFENILQSLQSLLPTYVHHNINDSIPLQSSESLKNDPSLFVSENISLESLIYEEYELLVDLVIHRSIAKKLSSDVSVFFDLLLQYAQITKDDEDVWEDDMNEYIKEEGEMSIRKDVRTQVLNLLSAVYKTRQINLLGGIVAKTDQVFASSNSTWKIKEAALYLLTNIIAEDHENQASVPQDSINALLGKISECQHDSNVLLRARAFLAGASICKSFSDRIDTASVKIPFFEATANTAASDCNDTVKAACLVSFQKYCPLLPEEYLVSKLNVLYQIISAMTPKADEDSPAIFAEVLMAVIQADFTVAVQHPNLVEIVYNLLSRDPTNVMLSNEIEDIMAELAENATEADLYPQFIQHALPPLLQSIMSIKGWDYTPELLLSLSLLGVIIDNGPDPVPEDIVNTFLEPLYKIVTNSTDNQVLQSVTETLSFLCDHASEQLKTWKNSEGRSGIEMLIMSVARLLDPSWEDSACVNTGLLIVSIVEKFSQVLGEYLPQILEATAKRLATAKSPVLIENFIKVFSKLISKNPKEVLDFLVAQQIEITLPVPSPDGTVNVAPGSATQQRTVSGLYVVISKWVSNFDILRGYEDIRENIVTLGHLYELQDPRIEDVVVEGDLLPVPDNVIMTRSRAKAYGTIYTLVSANVKIVKLFLRELVMGKFAEAKEAELAMRQSAPSLGQGAQHNDNVEDLGDDDWEEFEEETLLEGGISFNDAMKFSGIEDVSAAEIGAAEAAADPEGYAKRNGWAGSDHTTQLLIAGWLKNVATQNIGHFKEKVYPKLSSEEQVYIQKLV